MPEFRAADISKACRNYLSRLFLILLMSSQNIVDHFLRRANFWKHGSAFLDWRHHQSFLATGFYHGAGRTQSSNLHRHGAKGIHTPLRVGWPLLLYFGLSQMGRLGWNDYHPFKTSLYQTGHPPLERFFNLWRLWRIPRYSWNWNVFWRTYFWVYGIGVRSIYRVSGHYQHRTLQQRPKRSALAGFLKLLPVFISSSRALCLCLCKKGC